MVRFLNLCCGELQKGCFSDSLFSNICLETRQNPNYVVIFLLVKDPQFPARYDFGKSQTHNNISCICVVFSQAYDVHLSAGPFPNTDRAQDLDELEAFCKNDSTLGHHHCSTFVGRDMRMAERYPPKLLEAILCAGHSLIENLNASRRNRSDVGRCQRQVPLLLHLWGLQASTTSRRSLR